MKRLDWGEIVRLRDGEGLSMAEIGRRMGGKDPSVITRAYDKAKAQGWTVEGSPCAACSTGVLQPEVRSEVRKDRGAVPLEGEEIEGLMEILTWWRQAGPEGRSTSEVRGEVLHEVRARIGQTPRALYSFRIEKGLHGALKEQAERVGVSMADLVNEALRQYLGER